MCPQKKILQDLQAQITEWHSDGNQVIVLADMNEDVWEDPILAMAIQTGLQDAVTTQHGPSTPNTHNRGAHPSMEFLSQPITFKLYSQGTLHLAKVSLVTTEQCGSTYHSAHWDGSRLQNEFHYKRDD